MFNAKPGIINKGLNMVYYIEFFCLAPAPNPPDSLPVP